MHYTTTLISIPSILSSPLPVFNWIWRYIILDFLTFGNYTRLLVHTSTSDTTLVITLIFRLALFCCWKEKYLKYKYKILFNKWQRTLFNCSMRFQYKTKRIGLLIHFDRYNIRFQLESRCIALSWMFIFCSLNFSCTCMS